MGLSASDRSSTSQPALPFSNDTGPTSPDGQTFMTSPLLHTPTSDAGMREKRYAQGGANLGHDLGQLLPTPRHGKTTHEEPESWQKRQEQGGVATPPLSTAISMLTSSSAATPASPSPTRASAAAPRTPGTYGPSSPVFLASFDPDSHCWRTSQGTLALELERFSQTLPRWGMTRRGSLFALPTSGLPIDVSDGSASLNVPTPTASDAIWGDKDHSRRGISGNHNLGLTDWAKLLPTPDTKSDGFAKTPRQEADFDTNHAVSLGHAVNHLLPTATVRDHKGPRTGDYEPGDMLPEAIDKLLPTPKTPTGGPENRTSKKRRGSGGANLEGSLGDLTKPRSDDGNE